MNLNWISAYNSPAYFDSFFQSRQSRANVSFHSNQNSESGQISKTGLLQSSCTIIDCSFGFELCQKYKFTSPPNTSSLIGNKLNLTDALVYHESLRVQNKALLVFFSLVIDCFSLKPCVFIKIDHLTNFRLYSCLDKAFYMLILSCDPTGV